MLGQLGRLKVSTCRPRLSRPLMVYRHSRLEPQFPMTAKPTNSLTVFEAHKPGFMSNPNSVKPRMRLRCTERRENCPMGSGGSRRGADRDLPNGLAIQQYHAAEGKLPQTMNRPHEAGLCGVIRCSLIPVPMDISARTLYMVASSKLGPERCTPKFPHGEVLKNPSHLINGKWVDV